MPNGSRRPRVRTGDPDLDQAVWDFVERLEVDGDRDLFAEMLSTIARLARDDTDRGDLKIVNGALREMRNSFATFAPFRSARKASIFGSARVRPDEPQFALAVELGRALAAAGWMIITGGGPGIMTAAVAGAGRDASFAVTIRLPFEPTAASALVDDDHLVRFRYFFTRKLTFMKESSAYIILPGGFGTLDETFELLTLVQTGKETPAPIVLLDPPEDTYWQRWLDFVEDELVDPALVSPEDLDLVVLTSSVEEAVAEVTGFYRRYHSSRYVEGRLCIRMTSELSDTALRSLNEEFADIVEGGTIERCHPFPVELDDDDHPELPRLVFNFDMHHFARLHRMIRRINEL
jgi:uncharacterized protein (TIGR00730 family)